MFLTVKQTQEIPLANFHHSLSRILPCGIEVEVVLIAQDTCSIVREKFTENQIPTDLGATNSGPKAEQNVEVRIYRKRRDTFRCSNETIDDKQPPRQ